MLGFKIEDLQASVTVERDNGTARTGRPSCLLTAAFAFPLLALLRLRPSCARDHREASVAASEASQSRAARAGLVERGVAAKGSRRK